MTERERHFWSFLRLIGIPRRATRANVRFFFNWTALVGAHFFGAVNNVERVELRARMENFLPNFIDAGRS